MMNKGLFAAATKAITNNVTEDKVKLSNDEFIARYPAGARVRNVTLTKSKEGDEFAIVVFDDEYIFGGKMITDAVRMVLEYTNLPEQYLAENTVILKLEKKFKKSGDGEYFVPTFIEQ